MRQNIRTTVLKCEANEMRSVRKAEGWILSVWNEQLVNKTSEIRWNIQ